MAHAPRREEEAVQSVLLVFLKKANSETRFARRNMVMMVRKKQQEGLPTQFKVLPKKQKREYKKLRTLYGTSNYYETFLAN